MGRLIDALFSVLSSLKGRAVFAGIAALVGGYLAHQYLEYPLHQSTDFTTNIEALFKFHLKASIGLGIMYVITLLGGTEKYKKAMAQMILLWIIVPLVVFGSVYWGTISQTGDFTFGRALISILAFIMGLPALLLKYCYFFLLFHIVAFSLPDILHAFFAFSLSSDRSTRYASNVDPNKPDSKAAQAMAAVLEAEKNVAKAEAEAVKTMSSMKAAQSIAENKYQTKKAKEAREVLEAQTATLEEKRKLADALLKLEVEKRKQNDRR